MTWKNACQSCPVAKKRGSCLFGCNPHEKLSRDLDLLIEEADSFVDPVVEQLKQCPEAFQAGKAVERMFQSLHSAPARCTRRLLPSGGVMSPFV